VKNRYKLEFSAEEIKGYSASIIIDEDLEFSTEEIAKAKEAMLKMEEEWFVETTRCYYLGEDWLRLVTKEEDHTGMIQDYNGEWKWL